MDFPSLYFYIIRNVQEQKKIILFIHNKVLQGWLKHGCDSITILHNFEIQIHFIRVLTMLVHKVLRDWLLLKHG